MSERNFNILCTYLLASWYSEVEFKFRGRKSLTYGIPFATTTMMVESHWKILKRNYLIMHNRLLVDLVLYVIDSSFLGKARNDILY